MKETGIVAAEILLPDVSDLSSFACVACDQFTGDENYWKELEEKVADKPSALNLVLPEIYLGDGQKKRIEKINRNIEEYLAWDKIYAVGGSSFVKEAMEKCKE